MLPEPHILAHKYAARNRWDILSSSICGCFYCLRTFDSTLIEDWVDDVDGVGMTALCPLCGIDSVLGSHSGYPVEEGFLRKMKEYWFET